jgi:dTDP-4-amino-4,6-dideoxygalactose transaminase
VQCNEGEQLFKETFVNKKPIRDTFLVFGTPAIEDAEIQEVVATMRTGWLGTGPKVAKFERDFAAYKGVAHAVALNSCTAALHLSIIAAGINSGDEVITTPMTFCATVNAIIHAGATPVLADVDPATMNIDSNQIEAKITPKTKAILPVHFAGRPCEMVAICDIAQRYNLKIIEDCAHAIETEYQGKKAGTFGKFGCFSFYVTKNVATGEGGMVLTKHAEDAARIKTLGLHGMSKDAWKRFSDEGYKHYQVVECGFKYNMMDLQAAIGIHQLARVEQNWQNRKAIWNQYNTAFQDLPITTPAEVAPDTRHAYHLYTILIDEQQTGISRDAFLDYMTKQNIGVGVHYLSIPEHPYYQHTFGWKPDDYPKAMKIGRHTVSIPISAKLKEEDVHDVINSIYSIFKKWGRRPLLR